MEVIPEDLSTFRLSVSLPAWPAIKVGHIVQYSICVSISMMYIYIITRIMHSLKYHFDLILR